MKLPIKLKSDESIEIDPLEIEFIHPGLFNCEIHMVDGKAYEIWEDFSSLSKRITKSLES